MSPGVVHLHPGRDGIVECVPSLLSVSVVVVEERLDPVVVLKGDPLCEVDLEDVFLGNVLGESCEGIPDYIALRCVVNLLCLGNLVKEQ